MGESCVGTCVFVSERGRGRGRNGLRENSVMGGKEGLSDPSIRSFDNLDRPPRSFNLCFSLLLVSPILIQSTTLLYKAIFGALAKEIRCRNICVEDPPFDRDPYPHREKNWRGNEM